jgi:type I restriction enzyme M protein
MANISDASYQSLSEVKRWDAEAFTPYLLALDASLTGEPKLATLANVTHPAEIPRIYSDATEAIPFFRAQNIRPMLLDNQNIVRIPPKVANKLPTNKLRHGDILVTRSGAFSGVASVYLGATGACYTSGEGIIVRSHGEITGEYLVTYLNTRPGIACCRRAIYGSGQPHLAPKYLELLQVPRLGPIEAKAAALVQAAFSELASAEHLYPEAERELLDCLGWARLRLQIMDPAYAVDFSVLSAAGRSDPEFFAPHCRRLRRHIIKMGGLTISEFCEEPKRGVQPEFDPAGTVIAIDSKSVRPMGVEPSGEYVNDDFYNSRFATKARVKRDDVLLNSTGRGTLGRASRYSADGAAVCDNHVTILRPDPEVCDPQYLALFLNSPAGLMQSEQFQTGSSGQLEIYPKHIKQFVVFLPRIEAKKVDLAWQRSLARKIEISREARENAKAKLRDAIGLVERELILRGFVQ